MDGNGVGVNGRENRIELGERWVAYLSLCP